MEEVNLKNRQLELLIYLLEKKKSTYKELADKFEVSTKTIERDINRFSSIGIPVYCSQGVGGGVFIDENYKFSSSFFTQEDIHQIVLALRVMDSIAEKSKKDSVLQKLALLVPELTSLFEYDTKNYFSIDLLESKIDMDNDICKAINDCLDDEVLANIDEIENVACIGYVIKADGLYLFAHKNEYMMIKIEDIKEIKITDMSFERNFMTYEEYKKIQK